MGRQAGRRVGWHAAGEGVQARQAGCLQWEHEPPHFMHTCEPGTYSSRLLQRPR